MTMNQVREKFVEGLRERGIYVLAPNPVLCYVLDYEMGLDPALMPVDQPMDGKSYQIWVTDPVTGEPRRDVSGEPEIVTRKFTQEQRKTWKLWEPVLY